MRIDTESFELIPLTKSVFSLILNVLVSEPDTDFIVRISVVSVAEIVTESIASRVRCIWFVSATAKEPVSLPLRYTTIWADSVILRPLVSDAEPVDETDDVSFTVIDELSVLDRLVATTAVSFTARALVSLTVSALIPSWSLASVIATAPESLAERATFNT